MRLIGTVAILAASMLAGTALSQQSSAPGQAPATKAESTHHHGCKDMKDMKGMKDKHADRHVDKGARSENHADCGPGAKEKQKAKGENEHGQDKAHKHS